MTEQQGPSVDPGYGGSEQPHPHNDPPVDPSYGGENAPHKHDPREPGVDPAYGGDESPGFVHRAGLDAKEDS